MMSELMAWAAGGAQGIPIPYSPRMDDGITVILLCCFFCRLMFFPVAVVFIAIGKGFLAAS